MSAPVVRHRNIGYSSVYNPTNGVPKMADESPSAIDDLTGEYRLDPTHSRIGFAARHAMVTKVRGTFKQFDGKLYIDGQQPSKSSVEMRINMASIDTGEEKRDVHLRSADFFGVDDYPEMVFRSTSIEGDKTQFKITGDLTIRNTTQPVTFDLEYTGSAKDPFGNLRAGFEGGGQLNRKDWGLTWNAPLETGGLLVSEKIGLEFDISAIKS